MKQGWDVYNSDAVERGRAGWAMYPDIFKSEPLFLPKDEPYQRFRMAGSQFPTQSYDNFVRQIVPRWTSTDDATLHDIADVLARVSPRKVLAAACRGSLQRILSSVQVIEAGFTAEPTRLLAWLSA